MEIRRIDHLNMTVASFDETVDWYGKLFGFEIVEEDVDEEGIRWGVIRSGDTMLCIYEFADHVYEDRFQLGKRKLHRVSHFGLRMTDRQTVEKTLAEHGIEPRYGGPVCWPHSTSYYVCDPTGHEIELTVYDDERLSFSG